MGFFDKAKGKLAVKSPKTNQPFIGKIEGKDTKGTLAVTSPKTDKPYIGKVIDTPDRKKMIGIFQ